MIFSGFHQQFFEAFDFVGCTVINLRRLEAFGHVQSISSMFSELKYL